MDYVAETAPRSEDRKEQLESLASQAMKALKAQMDRRERLANKDSKACLDDVAMMAPTDSTVTYGVFTAST